MTNKVLSDKRVHSYGEKRNFRGLEASAIKRRLNKASHLIKALILENPGKELHVLELGCGFWGRNLNTLSREFPKVHFTGVDLTVTDDRQETLVNLMSADVSNWNSDRIYDGVLSLAVLEHLSDSIGHFALIKNCLKPRALAGLTTPTPSSHLVLETLAALGVFDREEINDHRAYFTETGLKTLAQESNLAVEEYAKMSLGMNQWILLRKP